MAELAPDVALAVELVELAELPRWPIMAPGLLLPTPRIHVRDSERFEDLLAWIASRSGEPPSFVQAAVANFGQVLADLMLVLNYEMNYRDNHYVVSQWYRLSY